VDTHSDGRSEENVSKKRSKKGADKRVRKRKERSGGEAGRREAKPESKTGASSGRGSHPTRAWTDEAKREAVALLERGDASIEQVAAELGVGPRTLREWQRRFDEEEENTPMTPEERREMTRLRKENERLRMECEILKKAATFFAKHRS
jgi:transposase